MGIVLTDLKNRIPAAQPVIKIKSNAYYLNNRQIFINFINSLFAPYRDSILAESAESVSCDSKSDRQGKSGLIPIQTDHCNCPSAISGNMYEILPEG